MWMAFSDVWNIVGNGDKILRVILFLWSPVIKHDNEAIQTESVTLIQNTYCGVHGYYSCLLKVLFGEANHLINLDFIEHNFFRST